MEDKSVTEIAGISGWVRSTHSRATRRQFTMKDLSIEDWELRVESLTTEEWKKYTNYIIDVSLDVTSRKGLRRGIQAVDSPAQSPSYHRTRTGDLEEVHAVVRDRNESLGDVSEKIITRWKCHDRTCGHKGTCWIDDTGDHHRLNALNRERWASAVVNGTATERSPPYLVIKSLMERNREGEDEKPSRKKSAID